MFVVLFRNFILKLTNLIIYEIVPKLRGRLGCYYSIEYHLEYGISEFHFINVNKDIRMRALIALVYFEIFLRGGAEVHENQTKLCRNNDGEFLPYEEFTADSCARCYKYMPSVAFISKLRYRFDKPGVLCDLETNQSYAVNPSNISQEILKTFANPSFLEKWVECCRAAKDCCIKMQNYHSDDAAACPQTWDGWQCWTYTSPGMIAEQPCPDHIYFEVDPPFCTKYALKECSRNGTWYTNEHSREWTNFQTCSKKGEYAMHLEFHVTMYIISVIAIVPSLIVFMTFKQLQVPRIKMHKHFFFSQLLNALFMILFKLLIVKDELKRSPSYETYIEQNSSLCKIIFTLTKYFRSTNYMWMFCEGFYLQKLIAATFAEQKSFIMFYIIGWVFPVVPVGIYAIIRATLADDKCWIQHAEPYEWIMYAPNLLSLIVNIVFLCNIIRVLVTKLRATHAREPSQYRKAVRATLVLVPLFGLHFCLIVYRPQYGNCALLQAYTFFNNAMDGLQGFLVSIIFCFMNGEVIILIKRTYARYKLTNEFRQRKNSMNTRRWSTTVSSINDSQHNNHHKLRNGEMHKLRDVHKGNRIETQDNGKK
ncbi:calcitonin gene-related peptide type 1 receptor isoform X2 [Parasteatoda tepidariorum]|uniref:calcitonin gene-related peptide type 1 receptor isoform X2 n=1 Tax=Parasteatoda tepidariorum TaxID=114398 RepID=UPI001C718FCD|nr:calcitonin gene-related peptide type 1 receptor-like isoform X2 [Parasteatoda tepidariorum]